MNYHLGLPVLIARSCSCCCLASVWLLDNGNVNGVSAAEFTINIRSLTNGCLSKSGHVSLCDGSFCNSPCVQAK